MKTQVFGNISTGRVSQWSFTWDDGKRRRMAKYNTSEVVAGKIIRGWSKLANTRFAKKLDKDSNSEREAQLIRNKNIALKHIQKFDFNVGMH